MTEEEKAEKYANKKAIENNMPADSEVIQYMAKAYLAGLHEGQPKWHDLRKAPNDLPDTEREVIIAFYAIDYGTRKPSKEIVTESCNYYKNQGWTDDSDGEPYPYLNKKGVIIAWCEIPLFKE